jgi:DNA excision repair protein ERCC-2
MAAAMEFPYSFRRSQKDVVDAMTEAVHGRHIVLEAGTGIGKTVCALYAAGSEALAGDKSVLYLVRTNSQQRQVILEARKLGLKTAALQGRHNLCPLLHTDGEFRNAAAEELSKACQDRKAKTLRGEEGCRYYHKLTFGGSEGLRQWALQETPTAEEVRTRCGTADVCPYEFTKSLLPQVKVVTAPYIYFFNPRLRHALLRWMAVPLEDIVLIVDEAHNLPDYARMLGSARMSLFALRNAMIETEEFGDPEVSDGVSITDVVDLAKSVLVDLAEEYVRDEDGLLPPSALEEALMSTFGTTSTRVKRMAQNMIVQGEIVREQKVMAGRIPRSYIGALGSFLLFWFNEEGWEYVRLVTGGDNPALECSCLDPSEVTRAVNDCWASIHMSGTLTPLEEYRDSIGLPPETLLRRFPSPFPPENRLVLVAEGLTTKYEVLTADPSAIARLKDELLRILLAVERNTAVFFPSHDLMRQFLDIRGELQRPLYVEEQNMEQSDLMELVERFRADNAVLFSVFGGRISEGMDFPAEDLELAVLVGVPYPKPTAKVKSIVNFYDAKFQRGWEYAVEAPTRRKLMQAIGRLIRSETDRGVAIVLDSRARRFRDSLPDMRVKVEFIDDIASFFAGTRDELTRPGRPAARSRAISGST